MKKLPALFVLSIALAASPLFPLNAQTTPAATSGTAPAAPAADTSAIQIKNGQSIVFLGDSITQYGWDQPGGYLHLVDKGLKSVGLDKIKIIGAGVSGQTSRDMLKRMQLSVLSRHPTWMTLSCGVNDVWHSVVDLDEYKQNVTSMVDQAQKAGIKVMILTATPIQDKTHKDVDFNKKLAPYNDFLRQFAKDRNLPLADINQAYWDKIKSTPDADGDMVVTVDGVHPNPEGNFLFTREILKAFGFSPAQLAAYEKEWRASDTAASVYAGFVTANGVPLTPEQSAKIQAAAKAQKMSPLTFEITLCCRSLLTALKAHEQDPDYSPAITSNSLTPEMNKSILAQIDALPDAPVPAPASVAPPATSGTNTAGASASAPAKPKEPRFAASFFAGRAVGVPLATYQNLLDTAKAKNQQLIPFVNPIFVQAMREVARKWDDKINTASFGDVTQGFIPSAYARFRELLMALPPAPPAPAPATTTSTNTPTPAAH